MKTLLAIVSAIPLLAVSVYGQSMALKDGSNIDPATWKTKLDVAAADITDAGAAFPAFAQAETAAAQRAVLGVSASEIFVNVKDYGAVGNGLANDTNAIHNAITYAQVTGNHCVFLPKGVYKCNLVISGNLHLIGAGSGTTGDWAAVGTPGATMLIPNSDSLPIVRCDLLAGIRIEKMELRGNGAGTTVAGLKVDNSAFAFSGNGLFVFETTIRRCTRNFESVGGCNVELSHCGLFEGNSGAYIAADALAHSYTFNLCSIGGVPATGSGRCFDVMDSSFVQITNCEQGNCTDYLYMASGNPIVNITNGNWETFSGSVIVDMRGGQLTWTGGRYAAGDKSVVRVTGTSAEILGVTLTGINAGGSCTLFETNGFSTPVITGISTFAPKRFRTWNTDFTTMTGDSLCQRIVMASRLTVAQAITTGITPVIFNVATTNIGSKYSATTGIFKPQKAGLYRISTSLRLSTVSGYAEIYIYKNATIVGNPAALLSGGSGSTLEGTIVTALAAGDEITVRLSSGGNCNIEPGTNFSTQFFAEEISTF